MAISKVGIEFVTVGKQAFDRSIKNQISQYKKFNTLLDTNKDKLKNIMAIEAKQISNNTRIVDGLKRRTIEIEKQNNLLRKQSSNGGGLGRGRASGSNFNAGLVGGALTRFLPAISAGIVTQQAFKNSIKLEQGYGQTARLLQTTKDSDEFANAKSQIQQIALDTKSNLFEVLEAYNESLSSGLSKEQTASLIRESSVLATGANINSEVTGGALVALANVFGKNPEDYKKYSGLLSGLIDESKGTPSTVFNAIPDFLSSAKNLNIPIAEQFASYGILTTRGIGEEESATAYKNFLGKLVDPSKALKDLLGTKDVAKIVYNEGTEYLLKQIVEHVKDKPEDERASLIQSLFPELRAFKAGSALIDALIQDPDIIQKKQDIILAKDANTDFELNADNVGNNLKLLQTSLRIFSDNVLQSSNSMSLLNTSLKGVAQVLNLFSSGIDKENPSTIIQDNATNMSDKEILESEAKIHAGNATTQDLANYYLAKSGKQSIKEILSTEEGISALTSFLDHNGGRDIVFGPKKTGFNRATLRAFRRGDEEALAEEASKHILNDFNRHVKDGSDTFEGLQVQLDSITTSFDAFQQKIDAFNAGPKENDTGNNVDINVQEHRNKVNI